MSKSRIFLYLLVAFIAGVAIRSFIPVSFFFLWWGVAAGAVLAALGTLRARREWVVFGFFAVAFIAGILRFEQIEGVRPDLSPLYGKELQALGVVRKEPDFTSKVQRLEIRVDKIDGESPDAPLVTLVTLGLYPRYKLGDELLIRGMLKEPENFAEDFDYRAYLAKDDIYSTFFFPQVERIGENKGGKLKLALSKIKHAFEEKIDLALPEPHAAFIKGLTLGERESLPEELVENFKRTGVTHIIALSGYNITLVASFFINVLLFLTIPFRFAFWIATAGIALFVLLTGASPSVVRAGIMGILVLVAQKEGRLYSIRNALVFAGAVMIFHNPKILRFDAAFQLSFMATLGLVYLPLRVEQWLDRARSKVTILGGRTIFQDRRKKLSKHHSLFPVKCALVETLSAQLMVLPLLIYLFGRVSIVSPLTNLLVILAVPYSMVMGLMTGTLGFLWEPLSSIAGWPTWALSEYMIRVIELFARLPAASIELGRWAIVPVLLLYVWVSWKWLSYGKNTKKS